MRRRGISIGNGAGWPLVRLTAISHTLQAVCLMNSSLSRWSVRGANSPSRCRIRIVSCWMLRFAQVGRAWSSGTASCRAARGPACPWA